MVTKNASVYVIDGLAGEVGKSRPMKPVPGSVVFHVVTLFAAVLALAFALCAAHPATALAWFNDVDEQNSAQQDLVPSGPEIYPSAIPDGVYQARAKTSSRMCVFYESAADAAGYDTANRELCTLSVSNGTITAVFYLSRAYTYLYMGTSEAAAQVTNAVGDDDSAYIKGEPDAQATSHLYTMAVPALNLPIEFASFDGGTRGIEGGKWYQRKVVFEPIAGSPLEKAINGESEEGGNGGSGNDSDDDGGDGDGGSDGSDGDDQPGEDSGDGDAGGDSGSPSDSGKPGKDTGGSPAGGTQAQSGGASAQTSSGTAQPGGAEASTDKPAAQEQTQADGKGPLGAASASTVRHGVLMSPAKMQEAKLDIDVAQAAAPEQRERGLTPTQVVAIALGSLAVVGVFLRFILFKRSLTSRPRQDGV